MSVLLRPNAILRYTKRCVCWDEVASDLLELALPDVHDDPEVLPAVQGVFRGVHLGRRGESQEVCKRIRRQGQKVES